MENGFTLITREKFIQSWGFNAPVLLKVKNKYSLHLIQGLIPWDKPVTMNEQGYGFYTLASNRRVYFRVHSMAKGSFSG